MARTLQEMPKMGLNVWSLSEVELLQVLTLNLCGFDPGLEAGSRLAIKSNLVIYLVPYGKQKQMKPLCDYDKKIRYKYGP